MKTYETHFEESCKLRDEFWSKIGKVQPEVLGHMINPIFNGGPRWPSARQSFKFIKTTDTTIIATDGLSDPYSDMETNLANASFNGLGIELYIETTNNLMPDKTTANSWEFNLLYQMAQQVAYVGSYAEKLEKYNYLATELYDVNVPNEFKNNEGRVGIFIGLQSPTVNSSLQLSLEKIKIVNLKLLAAAELQYISQHGGEGRSLLVDLFKEYGKETLSSIDRKSVY